MDNVSNLQGRGQDFFFSIHIDRVESIDGLVHRTCAQVNIVGRTTQKTWSQWNTIDASDELRCVGSRVHVDVFKEYGNAPCGGLWFSNDAG